MDKLRNMNKVILSSLNNYKVELGVIYSIKSFFEEWLSGCDEGEVFYKSIIGNTRAKASKLIETICDYKNHEYFKDCFISNAGTPRYVSQFYNGFYEAGKIRKGYLIYLSNKENLNKEKQRIENFFKPLFDNHSNYLIDNIYNNIDGFLEKTEGTYRINNKETAEKEALIDEKLDLIKEDKVITKGFFEEIEQFSDKYKGKNISYHSRFNKKFKENPVEATASLFILIMLGSWAGQAVEWLFPLNEYIDKTEDEIESENVYNQYLNKDYKEAKDLYEGTHKLYENGNKTPEICYVLAKLLRENTFIDETTTRKQQGIDLFNECIDEGENLSKTDSKDDIEKNYLKVVAQAAYELFNIKYKEQDDYYEISAASRKRNEEMRSYLKKAAQYNHEAACNIIGDLLIRDYLSDSDFQFSNKYTEKISNLKNWKISICDFSNNNFISDDEKELKIIDKAVEYFEKAGDGHSYLRIAQCLEKKGESKKKVLLMWAEAYKRGIYDAKKKIMEYIDLEEKVKNLNNKNSDFALNGKRVCILCSCSEENQMFAATLPENYQIILIKNSYELQNTWIEIDEKKRNIIIKNNFLNALKESILLGENKDQLNETIEDEIIIVDYGKDIKHKCERLETLFTYAKLAAQKYQDKYFISDRLKLCIDLSESMTELHIDRLERELEDLYIPVFDNMYEKNASIELLSKLPLFAMDMCTEKKKKERHIVILGHTNTSIQIIKDMVSVCVAEPLVYYYIHLVDPKAINIQKLFCGQCDEIVKDNKDINYRLEFNRVDELEYLNSLEELEYLNLTVNLNDVDDTNQNDIIENSKNSKVEKILLADCDYFVCSTDNDMLNLDLARKIRTWSMRNTKNYYDIPFIAVLNKDKKLCESLEGMTISTTRKIQYPWYEGLNLISFGALQDYYSYQYIDMNWIKSWGKAVDLAYCDKKQSANLHLAYNEFYSRWYNRDSSYMSALFFIYRLYSAGMYKKWFKWDFYAFIDEISKDYSKLLNSYNQYIKNPQRREEQAKLEHERWCEWIKSRGWKKQETDKQVENYMRSGNGAVKHQLHTAKIHPYIVSWEKLGQRIVDKIIFELEYLQYSYNKRIGISDDFELLQYLNDELEDLEKFQNSLYQKSSEDKNKETKKKIQGIVKKLEETKEKASETNEGKMKNVKEDIQICITRLNQILNSENFESTGLQAKMENWYEKYLNKPFLNSIREHNFMIVSRTSEFIEYAQQQIIIEKEMD